MKRIIVDYKKLNNEILDLIVEKYPDGYDREDIITFKNAKNVIVEAIEIKTDQVVYLVKVGVRLVEAMENHTEDDDIEEDEVEENDDIDLEEEIDEDDF